MFEKVTIIGFGLIGSSMARAIAAKNLAKQIACGDFSQEVCKRVLELNLAQTATPDLGASVQDADLIILAVPVGACESVAKTIAPFLKKGAIVTDAGSVKQAVIQGVAEHLPEGVHFVPAHPIAGTEHSGPDAGFAELFANRWAIITPLPDTDKAAVQKVHDLWHAFGSRVELMDPRRHDMTLAITSHLPHLIAYTIVGTATTLGEDMQHEVIKYSASGFRDFTRIAASNPTMWRDIFLQNKDAVLDILQRFNEDLTEMQKAIRRDDGDKLFDYFTKTRDTRRQIIDQGQAAYPAKQLETWSQPEQAPEKRRNSGS